MRQIANWTSRALHVALVTLLAAAAAYPTGEDDRKADSADSVVFRLETAKWSEPYNGPLGYPKGAQRATLSVDPVSGGETYYARFPAGSRFE